MGTSVRLGDNITLWQGDCLDHMATMAENSVDTIITDPPAGIGFMNKSWDSNRGGRLQWIDWLTSVLRECYRVAKPGATLLCWAIPRTSHWTGTAIELAGWEPVDVITHLFGSGFPKAANIGKQLDRRAGVERTEKEWADRFHDGKNRGITLRREFDGDFQSGVNGNEVSLPATSEAQEWDGWCSHGLKPAAEFWWVARKPNEGSYADNALTWGVAGLNIDGGRIEGAAGNGVWGTSNATCQDGRIFNASPNGEEYRSSQHPAGRWPANVVLDKEAARLLDEQSGERKAGGKVNGAEPSHTGQNGIYGTWGRVANKPHNDTGGASRFFYTSKASTGERNLGCEDLYWRKEPKRPSGVEQIDYATWVELGKEEERIFKETNKRVSLRAQGNIHSTVKPISLLQYLCRLTRTPTGGNVYDPFLGSGSTGVASIAECRPFIGSELDPDYFKIDLRRIEYAMKQVPPVKQESMF